MSAEPRASRRLQSIDLVRGVAMVLMALDHVRDAVSSARFDPTDLAQTTPGLFATRWITHLCAPAFCFLAGTSAFLGGARRTPAGTARFLATRGLALVFFELTVVHVGFAGWSFERYGLITLWALGWSMIALAGIVLLPRPTVAAGICGGAILLLHDSLDGIEGGALFHFLHQSGPIGAFAGIQWIVAYPVLPWIGVMAAGYAFGPIVRLEPARRRRWMLGMGAAAIVLFAALRWHNGYGDPAPWAAGPSPLESFLSFINCKKYPPSLDYTLATLGPVLIALGLADRARVPEAHPLLVFGRVPMFYYLVHLYVIRVAAVVACPARFHGHLLDWGLMRLPPEGGLGLGGVYVVWAAVVLALYLPSLWYARVKARSVGPLAGWLSYV